MIDHNDKIFHLVEVANTWQGEGPFTGRQMLIARFKYCNRHCQFCDTWIKMKSTQEGSYSINDLNKSLEKTKALMITGGEPTFNSKDKKINNLDQTILMLKYCNYQMVNIETNGYDLDNLCCEIQKMTSDDDIKIIYSPKIFSEEDYQIEIEKTKRMIKKPYLYIKVVVDDGEYSNKYIQEISKLTDDKGKIYLMPLGLTIEEIAKNWDKCIDMADDLNLNISTRMHIMNQFT